VVLLDGKSLRSGLSRELDFNPADRAEHLRRVAHIARILNDQGIITICSFASPDAGIREQVSEIIGADRFHLIYMDTDMAYCKKHADGDLYERYEKGDIQHIPGMDIPYEVPENARLRFKPQENETNAEKVMQYLKEQNIFPLE
jgi:adenylylsulfate kinase-like enzyme